jgi:hypothetical protein
MIKNFKSFRGICTSTPEEEFINANRHDILELRRTLGLLIDLYMPYSATAIKSDLEPMCAKKKKEF